MTVMKQVFPEQSLSFLLSTVPQNPLMNFMNIMFALMSQDPKTSIPFSCFISFEPGTFETQETIP